MGSQRESARPGRAAAVMEDEGQVDRKQRLIGDDHFALPMTAVGARAGAGGRDDEASRGCTQRQHERGEGGGDEVFHFH